MRLLVLTTSYPESDADPGGAFVAELAAALEPRGFESIVCPLGVPGGPLAALRAGRGLEVATALARFRTAIGDITEADAVLAHWLVPSALLGLETGLPVVGVAHGSDVRLLAAVPRVRRWLVGRLTGLVAVSEEAAKTLTHDASTATLVTPMGVDSRRFRPPPAPGSGPLRVLFLGRDVPIKGLSTLRQAVDGVPDVALTVAVDVPYSDVPGLLAAHDLLCVPSRAGEGSPRVVLEATAAGVPVLASSVGGLVDLVPPNWRLPPGDVAAWRTRLVTLSRRRDLLRPIAPPDRWDWSAVARNMGAFLRLVVPCSPVLNNRGGGSVVARGLWRSFSR